MKDLDTFLAMGGYAAYVWPAYIATFVVLVANLAAPMLRRRVLHQRLARRTKLARRDA